MASSKKNRCSQGIRKQCRSSGGSRQNTAEIVITAIRKLRKYTGWTARTIVKFIKMEYHLNNDPNLSRKVSRALKRGVNLGLLVKDRGRYRLNTSVISSSVATSRDLCRHRRNVYSIPSRVTSRDSRRNR